MEWKHIEEGDSKQYGGKLGKESHFERLDVALFCPVCRVDHGQIFSGVSSVSAYETDWGGLKKGGFLAQRSLSRSEDKTEIRAGEGTGGKSRERHPAGDTPAILGRREDPHCPGGPARRGEHRRAAPDTTYARKTLAAGPLRRLGQFLGSRPSRCA